MNRKYELFIVVPLITTLATIFFKSMWFALVTIILIFVLVGIFPFCRRRENLWLFILCAICLPPINVFVLREYQWWRELLGVDARGFLYYLYLTEITLICVGVEQVIVGVIGRRIWKRQYALDLPEIDDFFE